MSHPSSGPPWYPGQPDPNQPQQYGGYTGGPGQDPAASGPYGPGQPYGGDPAYPQQPPSAQPYGNQNYGSPGYGTGQESYTTEPPYSGQPYSGQPHPGQPHSGPPYSNQPYSGQPYSGQPYSGQPYDQGGYGAAPQPGYDQGYQQQQPNYGQQPYQGAAQPQYPPHPPQHSRGRGPMIALIAGLSVLVLLVCGVGGVVLLNAADEDDPRADPTPGPATSASAPASPSRTGTADYPATITLPPTVAGMSKLQDAGLQRTADETALQIKQATNADLAVAAYYAPSGDPARAVGIIGAVARISNPAGELNDAFNSSLKVTGARDISPGPLGGIVKCGNTVSSGTAFTVCGWADGGSLALGIFVNRSVDDSATLFVQIRQEILRRG